MRVEPNFHLHCTTVLFFSNLVQSLVALIKVFSMVNLVAPCFSQVLTCLFFIAGCLILFPHTQSVLLDRLLYHRTTMKKKARRNGNNNPPLPLHFSTTRPTHSAQRRTRCDALLRHNSLHAPERSPNICRRVLCRPAFWQSARLPDSARRVLYATRDASRDVGSRWCIKISACCVCWSGMGTSQLHAAFATCAFPFFPPKFFLTLRGQGRVHWLTSCVCSFHQKFRMPCGGGEEKAEAGRT